MHHLLTGGRPRVASSDPDAGGLFQGALRIRPVFVLVIIIGAFVSMYSLVILSCSTLFVGCPPRGLLYPGRPLGELAGPSMGGGDPRGSR